MLTKQEKSELIKQASLAASHAYAPYSRLRVGAAVLCRDGTIFRGSNVENRSFGLTLCAERNAVCAAVSAGKKEFLALAIYSPDLTVPLAPCGACRQVISEFTGRNFPVIMSGRDKVMEKTIADLLPLDTLKDWKKTED